MPPSSFLLRHPRLTGTAGADFEYGRLLAYKGEKARAREQFELVYSGKPLEVNAAGRKVRPPVLLSP